MASDPDLFWKNYEENQRILRRHLENQGSIVRVGFEFIIRGPPPIVINNTSQQHGSSSKSLSAIENLRDARVQPPANSGECAICLDSLLNAEKAVTKMPCDHLFHEKCVFKWLKKRKTCPACRRRV